MAYHLLEDIIGQEAVLDIRHLYVHGDAIVTGPLLLGGVGTNQRGLACPQPTVPGVSRV